MKILNITQTLLKQWDVLEHQSRISLKQVLEYVFH